MAVSTPASGATGNLFLDTLGAASATCLVSKLEQIDGPTGAKIAGTGLTIEHIVFPMHGVISTVATMRDGAMIEVMLTGREGVFGLPVVFGDDTSSNEAMVQIAGSLLRIRSADFMACLRVDSSLHARVLLYAQTTFTTMGQFAACNRLHPVVERCARWLLMAHDRVVGDELLLTHEYLGTMLGVRRPAVSLAASTLEEGGLIEYHRGRILVLNRKGLEDAACECYDAVNADCNRLMGYSVAKIAYAGTRG